MSGRSGSEPQPAAPLRLRDGASRAECRRCRRHRCFAGCRRLDPTLFDARYLLGYMLLKTGSTPKLSSTLNWRARCNPDAAQSGSISRSLCTTAGRMRKPVLRRKKLRKTAVTAEDVNRAEGTLRLLEANADPIVRAEPLPTRARQQSLAESSAAVKTEGLLTQVDCLGSRARLHLVANGRKLFLLVRDAGSVVLRNAGGVWTEFTCGPVPGRKVIVEYRRVANRPVRTADKPVQVRVENVETPFTNACRIKVKS